MRFGSVCSGIEAASVAWEPLGWNAAWFSEIEPFPCAVLAHHYPDVPNLGDMTMLPDRIVAGDVEAPDVFCGGTPCQAFSVAGKRQSLDDARGNLSLVFCEIANAIDDVRSAGGNAPAIIFWENVPGVLNTKDNAFGCFLGELAGEDCALQPPGGGKWSNAGAVYGPKRAVAWRVLDAQYFGVAQRRRRVFVVASARTDIDPAAILFEFDGLRRDSAPSREAGESVTGTIEASLGRSRGAGTPAAAITAARMVAFGEYADDGTASTCKARDYKDATDLVVHPIDCRGVSPTLTSKMQGSSGWAPYNETEHLVPVAQPIVVHGTQDPCVSDIGFALGRNSGQENAVMQSVAFQPGNLKRGCGSAPNTEVFPTLAAGHGRGTSDQDPHVLTNMQVRRLTPVECERLQGFPDSYTQIPWRNKPASECPDGPRYKALGNSWAVPNVRWIGERIRLALEVAA